VTILGTALQDVYDAFFQKVPDVDFTGKESLVYQFLKTSIGYCYKTVPESLKYTLSIPAFYEGNFDDELFFDTVELLSLGMARECYLRDLNKLSKTKQHIGTQAFNKLPDLIKQYNIASDNYKNLDDKFESFRQEFYSYKN
jgi:hypothetical protein